MIGRVLLVCLSAFLVGGVGLYVASRNQEPAVRRSRLTKFITYFCIVTLVVAAAFAGSAVLAGLMAVVVALGARELYRVLPQASRGHLSAALGIGAFYLLVAAGAVGFSLTAPANTAVFVYLVVCAFDGFSQVCGQMLGRHRLAPRISPGKTIEGSVGGLLAAAGMALVLRPLVGWSLPRSLLACCFIVAAALTGDLLASLVKRRSGIKDYGNLLPGHGGILDRFDSFLFAAAACMLAEVAARLFGRALL